MSWFKTHKTAQRGNFTLFDTPPRNNNNPYRLKPIDPNQDGYKLTTPGDQSSSGLGDDYEEGRHPPDGISQINKENFEPILDPVPSDHDGEDPNLPNRDGVDVVDGKPDMVGAEGLYTPDDPNSIVSKINNSDNRDRNPNSITMMNSRKPVAFPTIFDSVKQDYRRYR